MNQEFNDLKQVLHGNDSLQKLKQFGDILEKITKHIIESKNKSNDISYLSDSIKKQKVIFDQSEKLYEVIRVEEGVVVDDIDGMVDRLNVSFEDYKKFVAENEK
ncbi:hypothetical protein BDAP_002327 [Binucleata daphniae]